MKLHGARVFDKLSRRSSTPLCCISKHVVGNRRNKTEITLNILIRLPSPSRWINITHTEVGDHGMKVRATQSFSSKACVQILQNKSFPLMKWQSISICLVWSCCTRLWAMMCQIYYYNKDSWIYEEIIWAQRGVVATEAHKHTRTPSAINLNSVSALDLWTTNCFLLLQVIWLPPTKL